MKTLDVGAHGAPGWERVFLDCFRPKVDHNSFLQWGSMPVLVRDLAS